MCIRDSGEVDAIVLNNAFLDLLTETQPEEGRQIESKSWIGLVLICFILPAILSWAFGLVLRKWGWIKENDLKLDL